MATLWTQIPTHAIGSPRHFTIAPKNGPNKRLDYRTENIRKYP